jgi:hypothetical protein
MVYIAVAVGVVAVGLFFKLTKKEIKQATMHDIMEEGEVKVEAKRKPRAKIVPHPDAQKATSQKEANPKGNPTPENEAKPAMSP